jgi:hypothetical protein
MNKGLVAVALIATASLIIAVVALSQSYLRLYPETTPTPTIAPTAPPTATPNLSLATPDNSDRISISVTALNTAHFPQQWMPIYYIHITNKGDSSIKVVSIICTAIDNQSNFTYWSGNQDISPNATGNFSASNSYYAEWPMNDIYVYYQVSGQLFVHSLAHIPLPTYSPAS